MIPCPKCRAPAGELNQRTHRHTVYRQFKCRSCLTVWNTHEKIVRNEALERQLTAEELEKVFGKPKFKYKTTPPRRM
jgi:hypothetical protein